MTPLRRIVLGAVALALTFGAYAASRSPEDLVLVRHGTLPIILTAPHGGRLDIPGVIERLTGHAPYLVLAKFKRKFVDANRPAELAYVGPAATPYYALYHGTVRKFVDEIRRAYPAGLLLDVHGEGKDPDVLMRGTSNGNTVTLLVRRAGVGSITGPNGLFGQFETQGFKVFPSNRVSIWHGSENAGYNGGYTVNAYVSQNLDGIDALQLEFGTRYRREDELGKSAARAARAIVTFYKAYLETAGR